MCPSDEVFTWEGDHTTKKSLLKSPVEITDEFETPNRLNQTSPTLMRTTNLTKLWVMASFYLLKQYTMVSFYCWILIYLYIRGRDIYIDIYYRYCMKVFSCLIRNILRRRQVGKLLTLVVKILIDFSLFLESSHKFVVANETLG